MNWPLIAAVAAGLTPGILLVTGLTLRRRIRRCRRWWTARRVAHHAIGDLIIQLEQHLKNNPHH